MDYKVTSFLYIHKACQICGYDIPESLSEYRNFEHREYGNFDIHIAVNCSLDKSVSGNYISYYFIKSTSLYGCYIIQTLKKMLER